MTVKLYGMSSEGLLEKEEVEYKSFLFSAGEVQVRLPDISAYENLVIDSRYPTSQDIIEILMLQSAISEVPTFFGNVSIFLPYLPYSRQDRVCWDGEAFSLEVFARLLTNQFKPNWRIITWDVHSGISMRLFKGLTPNGLKNVTADKLIRRFEKSGMVFDPDTVVVAPDRGAKERATLVAKAIGANRVVYGAKVRSSEDGSITDISFQEEGGGSIPLTNEKVLIVDDICDGGRTFIELAKALREFNPLEITLYVTHGIFSRGFDVFYQEGKLLIDKVLVANLKGGDSRLPTQLPKNINAPGYPRVYPEIRTLR